MRVVSIPSTDVFDAQSAEYKESVLPAAVTKRVAIEAGIADYWYKYVGFGGRSSACAPSVSPHQPSCCSRNFGFTVETWFATRRVPVTAPVIPGHWVTLAQ